MIPQPAFASELFHEGSAFRRINDLCHVLTAYVEDLRVVVGVKEFGHFDGEGLLFRGELKVHDVVLPDDPAGSQVTEFGSADVKFAGEHFASVLA